MKLLFCLMKYFPFGGLQRDFRNIANACLERGHEIHVLVSRWEGEIPAGFHVTSASAKGFTNHARIRNFAGLVSIHSRKARFDAVIGFNKLPCLDLYYAADRCYKAKVMEEKSLLYRMGNRYRTYAQLEKAVFDVHSQTQILLISEREKEKFMKYYGTAEERFHSLPPGIEKGRCSYDPTGEIRREVRTSLGLIGDEFFLLMVGSSFGTKGLDRSIRAVAALPGGLREKTRLIVIGQGDIGSYRKLALRHNVEDRIHFLGGRDDVPRFLSSADLLLHPAYSENTGTVLLEALLSGLPVLVTENCGYAFHVKNAGAGCIVPLPFQQRVFDALLRDMLVSDERKTWSENGLYYASHNDFFSMPRKAADIIESLAARKNRG